MIINKTEPQIVNTLCQTLHYNTFFKILHYNTSEFALQHMFFKLCTTTQFVTFYITTLIIYKFILVFFSIIPWGFHHSCSHVGCRLLLVSYNISIIVKLSVMAHIKFILTSVSIKFFDDV